MGDEARMIAKLRRDQGGRSEIDTEPKDESGDDIEIENEIGMRVIS
jgi:hypothetical protein